MYADVAGIAEYHLVAIFTVWLQSNTITSVIDSSETNLFVFISNTTFVH